MLNSTERRPSADSLERRHDDDDDDDDGDGRRGAIEDDLRDETRRARDDVDDVDDAVTSDDARGPMPEKSRILEGPPR